MKTSRRALIVLASVLLCVCSAVGQEEAGSDAAVVRFENTLVKAKNGDMEATASLDAMYARGFGVIQDVTEAVNWFRTAAELGDADVMFLLGLMYDAGRDVLEDNVEAYAWFNVAAVNGQKQAAESRETIRKEMTPEQIAEGQTRSREIMKSIAKE